MFLLEGDNDRDSGRVEKTCIFSSTRHTFVSVSCATSNAISVGIYLTGALVSQFSLF
jgi:hypothetical protein